MAELNNDVIKGPLKGFIESEAAKLGMKPDEYEIALRHVEVGDPV